MSESRPTSMPTPRIRLKGGLLYRFCGRGATGDVWTRIQYPWGLTQQERDELLAYEFPGAIWSAFFHEGIEEGRRIAAGNAFLAHGLAIALAVVVAVLVMAVRG